MDDKLELETQQNFSQKTENAHFSFQTISEAFTQKIEDK